MSGGEFMIANTGLIGITFWILACIGIENNKSIQQVLPYLLMGTLIILVGIAVEKLQNYRDELEEIRRQKRAHLPQTDAPMAYATPIKSKPILTWGEVVSQADMEYWLVEYRQLRET